MQIWSFITFKVSQQKRNVLAEDLFQLVLEYGLLYVNKHPTLDHNLIQYFLQLHWLEYHADLLEADLSEIQDIVDQMQ